MVLDMDMVFGERLYKEEMCMKVSIKMIKSMVMEYINGKMVVITREILKMTISMVKEQ